MKWQLELRDSEQDELARADKKREAARIEYAEIRGRLKNRCDARLRRANLKASKDAAAFEAQALAEKVLHKKEAK